MKSYLIPFILFSNFNMIAQIRNDTLIKVADIYGIEVHTKKLVDSVKCPCDATKFSSKSKCYIYNIEISKVYFQRDFSVYKDTNELKKVQYLVVQGHTLRNGLSSTICTNSASSNYLYVTQIYDSGFSKFSFNKKSPHFSGLTECKRRKAKNVVNKIIEKHRLSYRKIY